jgi:hypothetical protein
MAIWYTWASWINWFNNTGFLASPIPLSATFTDAVNAIEGVTGRGDISIDWQTRDCMNL